MSSNDQEDLSNPPSCSSSDEDCYDWIRELKLKRKEHVERLVEGLTEKLPPSYQRLVPAQTWTTYWITQSLALLERSDDLEKSASDVIGFINQCANPDGGYGGGPGQIAHLATTYAAVNALVSLSNEEALESIDRTRLIQFMHRMKRPDGSFTMHEDGEIDARASYCALAVLKCLNIEDHILIEKTADWLLTCQTYEGGFGSVPNSEAHGGYTYCCVAALSLLGQLHRCDLQSLLRWLTSRQMTKEGGFSGRSNKLVDSCYSFWQGAVFPIIHPVLFLNSADSDPSSSSKTTNKPSTRKASEETKKSNRGKNKHTETNSKDMHPTLNWLFNSHALQEYIIDSCQAENGLLVDKPDASPDFYHTCYALSGLSISQYGWDGTIICNKGGHEVNLLAKTHPLFNLTLDSIDFCYNYFKNKKILTVKTYVEGDKGSSSTAPTIGKSD